jgi:hypothetical protein
VSLIALIISTSGFAWTWHEDNLVHRPYLGMDAQNAGQLLIGTTSLSILVQVTNFGDIPAHYIVKISYPLFSDVGPFQPFDGYLMPSQEMSFEWAIPLNQKVDDGGANLCNALKQSAITFDYGEVSTDEHLLRLSPTLISAPVSIEDLRRPYTETAIASTTPILYGCEANPSAVVWTVTGSD